LAEIRGNADAQQQHYETLLREAETRAEAAEGRLADLEAEVDDARGATKQAEAARAKAERDLQKAQAAPAPSPATVSPGTASEKQLRVRVSDLMEEVKALKSKLQKAGGGGGSAEIAKLKEEIESLKAENNFLTEEMERTRDAGIIPEELTSPGGAGPKKR
jgi:chromosome segregation ATPase